MPTKRSQRCFLIQWIEDGPVSWDVVSEHAVYFVSEEDGTKDHFSLLGTVVDVDWKGETTPAKILRVSGMYSRNCRLSQKPKLLIVRQGLFGCYKHFSLFVNSRSGYQRGGTG